MKLSPAGLRQVLGHRSGSSGLGAGTVVAVTTFSSGSSGTFSPNAATRFYIAYGVAGGGGGGGVGNTSGDAGAGGGGGGGGYFVLYVSGRRKGLYSVGAAGNGGVGAGSAGNDTTFRFCTAVGGPAGGAGGTSTAVTAAQAYQPTSNADVIRSPEHGGLGYRVSSTLAMSGKGGSNPLGRGGRSRDVSDGAGTAGTGFGGGGGGGCGINSAASRAGGNGSNGVLIIVEYR